MKTIRRGGTVAKDPNSKEVFRVNWDREHLEPGVLITDSTWEITGPDAALTFDSPAIIDGGRNTRLRLLGGTLAAIYTVTNKIVTNETPTQEKFASWFVRGQKR